MGIQCRGVEKIKTLGMVRGSGAHSSERHVRQFQVASLELERSRRMKERQANLRRIQEIDSRLREINDLICKHHESLGLLASGEGAGSGPAHAAESMSRGQHVLRY